ncbi:MAG: putative monocarboxylate transporter mch1 [Thelocarpon superellum]|nr:MAG: putative monocarboxylate transporter mch1 [Thelocarpon superellum]
MTAVIDLCLSDTPERPRPRRSVGAIATSSYILLSDETDGGLVDDCGRIEPPRKKRKPSPLLPPTSPSVIDDAAIESLRPSPEPATLPKATTCRKSALVPTSVPISLISSPIEIRAAIKATGSASLLAGLSDESDDLPDDIVPTRPKGRIKTPPKLVSQLSARTAALLADINCNAPARRPRSSKSGVRRVDEDLDIDPRPVLDETASQKHPVKRKRTEAQEEQARIKAREKELEKERKQRLREQKAREKQVASDLARINRARTDKKISTAEMIVDLSSSLGESVFAVHLRRSLKNLEIETSSHEWPMANIIRWRRKVMSRFNAEMGHWEAAPRSIQKEGHVLCFMSAKELVALACPTSADPEGQDLDAHVRRMKSHFDECTPIYLIEGLAAWMRKNKNVRNRAYQAAVMGHTREPAPPPESRPSSRRSKKAVQTYVDEDAIEDALLRLQVAHECLIHHTHAAVETAEWITNFTQHISTIPYRTQRMNLETGFCMDSGQVKTGDNADDTYVRMLQEIIRVTAPVAHGIASEFGSVRALVSGLEEQGPLALQSLKKTANKNGAFTDGNIGPAISKRIFKIFTGRDPSSTEV